MLWSMSTAGQLHYRQARSLGRTAVAVGSSWRSLIQSMAVCASFVCKAMAKLNKRNWKFEFSCNGGGVAPVGAEFLLETGPWVVLAPGLVGNILWSIGLCDGCCGTPGRAIQNVGGQPDRKLEDVRSPINGILAVPNQPGLAESGDRMGRTTAGLIDKYDVGICLCWECCRRG